MHRIWNAFQRHVVTSCICAKRGEGLQVCSLRSGGKDTDRASRTRSEMRGFRHWP